VVTNGYDRVQRSRIGAARLDAFFQVVVTSEACGFAKPDPRILGIALQALETSPAHALYVGDDVRTDGGAARAAGVAFWWLDRGAPLPRGVRRPRRRVASLAELAERLAGGGL
jgi:FMN phosphatase YigB (HAD superfamily)